MDHPNVAPVTAGLKTIMRKYVLPGLLCLVVASCGAWPAAPTPLPTDVPPTPATSVPSPLPTDIPPVLERTSTPYVPTECAKDRQRKVCIRWAVGLGTGGSPSQVAVEQKVIEDFNASQDKITLVLEGGPWLEWDTLTTQIDRGDAPDIVGPVGWQTINGLHSEWLDLSEQIAASGFDTGIFDPALVRYYQTEAGQVSLPFAVFPGAIYYLPAMFDAAGLDYPPQKYGEKYKLDGRPVDWNWETVTQLARRLTLDKNGRNATRPGFDRTQIVQIGYSPQFQELFSVATFYSGAAKVYEGSGQGSYKSTIPESWKAAWQWYYDGMWGEQPFIPTGPLAGSVEFGAGNVFNSGKAAMGLTQAWYTCCLGEFIKAGDEFQLAIQPMGADGKVHGRIDTESFLIWRGSKHPAEAFQVLSYLLTAAADELLPVYDAMPAIASKAGAFIDRKKADYPFVTDASWNVFVQGFAYPDIPSVDQYQPHLIEAEAREQEFLDLMNKTTPDQFDFEAEFKELEEDLNVIYNK